MEIGNNQIISETHAFVESAQSLQQIKGLEYFRGLHWTQYLHRVLSLSSEEWKNVVADGLGLGLACAAVLVQLPQIYSIVANSSATGISEGGMLLGFWSCLTYVSYNYLQNIHWLTWGDAIPGGLETLCIILLMWLYSPRRSGVGFKLGNLFLIGAFIYCVQFGVVPNQAVPFIGLMTVPLNILSRLPQVMMNMKNKHTGTLSLITLLMQMAGNIARLFSTYVQVKDNYVMATHVVAFLCNLIPTLQILYYWRNTQQVLKTQQGHRTS